MKHGARRRGEGEMGKADFQKGVRLREGFTLAHGGIEEGEGTIQVGENNKGGLVQQYLKGTLKSGFAAYQTHKEGSDETVSASRATI